jgi:hypothetical protein
MPKIVERAFSTIDLIPNRQMKFFLVISLYDIVYYFRFLVIFIFILKNLYTADAYN